MNDLRALTETILSGEKNFDELNDTVAAMREFYNQRTGIEAKQFSEEGIELPTGLAISPYQAADCLVFTPQRTAVFLRGIYKAILQLLDANPGQRINILYAGSGPYATLLTPFTTFFSPEQINFYLLDINEESLRSAEILYTSLGIQSYIARYIAADAATFKMPEDITMHLVISETMQRVLGAEPQVAIMLNLIPQMKEDAIFIPEEIIVSMGLTTVEDSKKNDLAGSFQVEKIDLGSIYVIGRRQCEKHRALVKQMPASPGRFVCLTMYTDITVFDTERLTANNCSLNFPLQIADISELGGARIQIQYDHSSNPKFIYNWFW